MECNELFLQHLMLSRSIKNIVAGDTNQLTFAMDRYLEPVIGYWWCEHDPQLWHAGNPLMNTDCLGGA